MRQCLAVVIAIFMAASAQAETNPNIQKPPMVRNIGIAELGDAIVVRERKTEPASTGQNDCGEQCR